METFLPPGAVDVASDLFFLAKTLLSAVRLIAVASWFADHV